MPDSLQKDEGRWDLLQTTGGGLMWFLTRNVSKSRICQWNNAEIQETPGHTDNKPWNTGSWTIHKALCWTRALQTWEDSLRMWRSALTAVTMRWWAQEKGKTKDHNTGLEGWRLWPLWDLPGPCDTTLKRKLQRSWFLLRDYLLQTQEWSIGTSGKSSTGSRRPAWMNITKLWHKREVEALISKTRRQTPPNMHSGSCEFVWYMGGIYKNLQNKKRY